MEQGFEISSLNKDANPDVFQNLYALFCDIKHMADLNWKIHHELFKLVVFDTAHSLFTTYNALAARNSDNQSALLVVSSMLAIMRAARST
jgi:hypothetical protein